MSKLEKEIISLIKLGKRTGDMKLRNHAQKALRGLNGDDGTYGLGEYLWVNEVQPNLAIARKRAEYHHQTKSVINTARILAKRRYSALIL